MRRSTSAPPRARALGRHRQAVARRRRIVREPERVEDERRRFVARVVGAVAKVQARARKPCLGPVEERPDVRNDRAASRALAVIGGSLTGDARPERGRGIIPRHESCARRSPSSPLASSPAPPPPSLATRERAAPPALERATLFAAPRPLAGIRARGPRGRRPSGPSACAATGLSCSSASRTARTSARRRSRCSRAAEAALASLPAGAASRVLSSAWIPERDTPEHIGRYVAHSIRHSSGATGEPARPSKRSRPRSASP